MKIDEKVLNLKKRYPKLHPLIFSVSVEKANSLGELFDILETVPELPVGWNDDLNKWENVNLEN
jgi:aminopeptidase-like protein